MFPGLYFFFILLRKSFGLFCRTKSPHLWKKRVQREEMICRGQQGRERDMTIQEIEEKFCVPSEKLKRYESEGLIAGRELADGTRDYDEAEVRELGIIFIFTEAGFTCEEIRQFLALDGKKDGADRQMRMLRKKRGELLERIHCEQKLLDKIDYIIREKKNGDF